MRGRVIQSSGPLNLAVMDGMNVHDSRISNYPPRYNGAPSQVRWALAYGLTNRKQHVPRPVLANFLRRGHCRAGSFRPRRFCANAVRQRQSRTARTERHEACLSSLRSAGIVNQGRRRCKMRWQFEQTSARSATLVFAPRLSSLTGIVW
jgi:hypothetical protein